MDIKQMVFFKTRREVDAAVPDNISNGRDPGDIRFVDVNKDGQVDSKDRTDLGSPIPKFLLWHKFSCFIHEL